MPALLPRRAVTEIWEGANTSTNGRTLTEVESNFTGPVFRAALFWLPLKITCWTWRDSNLRREYQIEKVELFRYFRSKKLTFVNTDPFFRALKTNVVKIGKSDLILAVLTKIDVSM